MQTETVGIILADAHPFSRTGLEQTLSAAGLDNIIEADSRETCLRLLAQHKPCLLLLASNLLPPEPVPFITALHKLHPETGIILFITNRDGLPMQALDGRVRGLVTKSEPKETLVRVVQQAAAGQRAFSPRMKRALANLAPADATPLPPHLSLTARDCQLLNLLAQGMSNREIAATLHLAYQTVRNNLSQLYQHIAVTNRVEAVRWAYQHGLLPESDG